MQKVYVSGSIAFDYLMVTTLSLKGLSFPEQGTATHSIIANDLFKNDGGTAGNIAHNLSLLSVQSSVVTSVGSDAQQYLARLASRNIDVSSVTIVPDCSTAHASALTDSVGNQIFFFCPGAMDIPSKLPEAVSGWAIVAPGNHVDMKSFPEKYRSLKVPYIYDPGQMIHSMSAESLIDGCTGAHTLIMNEFEWGEFSRKTGLSIEDALTRSEVVIVTRGEQGASVYGREKQYVVPAVSVQAIDTMGAGDAFRAGYIFGIMHGATLEIAAFIGCTLASFSVEKRGTQTHNPSRHEIAERYTRTYAQPFPEYTGQL